MQDGVVAALRVLGDGNWNMGAATGNMRRVGEAQEVDDRGILEHFTCELPPACLTNSISFRVFLDFRRRDV